MMMLTVVLYYIVCLFNFLCAIIRPHHDISIFLQLPAISLFMILQALSVSAVSMKRASNKWRGEDIGESW
ncbi:hypothetical protein F4604DRAFT_1750508 [Suillus subluteus]|nr:hypothetical protein F4604DRAFT_1750508 [Suillus subluteus]